MKKLALFLGAVFISVVYANPNLNLNQGVLDNTTTPHKIHAVITSETMATVSSPMAGYIDKLNIKEGSHFKKDQILVEFDCKIQQAELQKARAEIKLAKVNRNSYGRLARLGSASKVKVAESQAQYEKALAEQIIAKKHASDCQIKAPFKGQITDLFAHQHETMQLHQKLFTILANDSIVVRVFVPSDWLSWLKVGSTFQLHIKENNKTYPVIVERMINQVDAVSRSVKIIGLIKQDNPELKSLKSGMSGEATFFQGVNNE